MLIFLVIIYLRSAHCFVDLSYFGTYVSNLVEDKNADLSIVESPREICDENQMMLQLAKMYIVSPERVLMLLATNSIPETCKGVSKTIENINKTQTGCIPLSSENLYMKLLKTVKFFHLSVCQGDSRLKKKISKIGDCLPELREEFLNCEGTPDWYENTNETLRCQALNNIANCNYVKTAMLCGLEAATTIRGFTTELFQQAFPSNTKCKVSRSLPLVQDPMCSLAGQQNLKLICLTPFIVFILIKKNFYNCI